MPVWHKYKRKYSDKLLLAWPMGLRNGTNGQRWGFNHKQTFPLYGKHSP